LNLIKSITYKNIFIASDFIIRTKGVLAPKGRVIKAWGIAPGGASMPYRTAFRWGQP